MPSTEHLVDRLRTGPINRRQLVGGTAGIATAATAVVALGSLVSAQTSDSATATPEAGSGGSDSGTTLDATAITDRSAAVIASVTSDRDALASSLDTTVIDELLSLAADLQAKAEAAPAPTGTGRRSGSSSSGSTSSGTTSSAATPDAAANSSSTTTTPGKIELAFAAARTAQAARATIVAQLATFGLPSEQARLSRGLSQIYAAVKALATEATSSSEADASALVSHAEAAYTNAYDAYTAKTYASVTAYGEATAHLAAAASVLLGLREGKGMGGMDLPGFGEDGRGGRMSGGRGGNQQSGSKREASDSGENDSSDATPAAGTSSDSDTESPDDPSTPVDVPAPSF